MSPGEGAPAQPDPGETLAILRRLDAGRSEFVTYKSLITILISALGAYGLLGGWFISTKLDSVAERNEIAIERKFVEMDRRLTAIESRLLASIDGGIDRLHASIEGAAPSPDASIVEWRKPEGEIDLPPEFASLIEQISPVGIYTLSPELWLASEAPEGADKLDALRLLLGDGALEPVFPQN